MPVAPAVTEARVDEAGFLRQKNGETWRVVTNWKYKVGLVISYKCGDI